MKRLSALFGGSNAQPSAYDTLVAQSMEELRVKTTAHDGMWRIAESSWSVDQDEGTITFSNPRGITVTAPVQIIGTYNLEDGTWLWGWDNPSVVPALADHARQVHAYGQQHNIERLLARKLQCSENEAWEFTAVACKLGDAQGAYRGPAGTTLVFMTFGNVVLRGTPATDAS